MFQTHCTKCGSSNQIPPHYKGQSIKCGTCGDRFIALKDEDRLFKFHCSECGGSIETEVRMKGSSASCPHCNRDIIVTADSPSKSPERPVTPALISENSTGGVGSLAPDSPRGDVVTRTSQLSPAALIIITLLGIIIAGGGFVAYKQGVFTKPDPIVEAAKTPDYKENLKGTLAMIVLYASQAETLCQDHAESWQSATKSRYRSIDDAIRSSVAINAGSIGLLKEGKSTVASMMKKLQGPPAEYASIYDKFITLFGQFNSFADMAISPSGSLVTYTQSFRRLQEDLIRGINEIQVMIPE